MSAALVPIDPAQLADNGEALPGLLREDAYILPLGLSFDRWHQIGATLQQMQRSINWWAGDWLKYGRDHFGEDAYQSVRDAVADATGHGKEALRQALWVAERFPVVTRVTPVSWSHYRAVAEIQEERPEEALALLQEAAREKLSTRRLIERAEERKAAIKVEATAGTSVCAADLPWVPMLDDLLPEWRQRALACGQPQGYLAALRDTGAEACFREGRWLD